MDRAVREPQRVEVFARWVHDALAETLAAEGAETLRVRVWESENEFAGYAADLPAAERGVPAEA
jgi:6-pyruvoyl tetrahydropterin synthase-like protein